MKMGDAFPLPYSPKTTGMENSPGFAFVNGTPQFGFPGLGSEGANFNASEKPFMLAMHALGIRKGDIQDGQKIAFALAKLAGFTAPVFIVRPFYPTEANHKEFERLIHNGLTLMSATLMDPDHYDVQIQKSRLMNGYVHGNPKQP